MIKKIQDKGITLVALVITIIILLILAELTIAQITENGLFEKAKIAEQKQLEAKIKEKIDLLVSEYAVEREQGKPLYKFLTEKKDNGEIDDFVDNNDGTFDIIITSYTTTINENEVLSKSEDYRDYLLCEYSSMQINNNVLVDDSGNNVNGQVVGNSIEVRNENKKNYIRLDGNSYIYTSEFPTLTENSQKTILCNFRTDDSSNEMTIMELGNNDRAKGGIPPSVYKGFFHFETGYNNYLYNNNNIALSDNKWHFVCITFDSNTLAVYIDNKQLYVANATINTVTPNLYIGSNHGVRRNFIGDISDVRVYDKGLSMEEVNIIYKKLKK